MPTTNPAFSHKVDRSPAADEPGRHDAAADPDSQATTEAAIQRCAEAVEAVDGRFPAETIATNALFRLAIIRARRWGMSPSEALYTEATLEESALREVMSAGLITADEMVVGLGAVTRVPFLTRRAVRLPRKLRRRRRRGRSVRTQPIWALVLYGVWGMSVLSRAGTRLVTSWNTGQISSHAVTVSVPVIALISLAVGYYVAEWRDERRGRSPASLSSTIPERAAVPRLMVSLFAPHLSKKQVVSHNDTIVRGNRIMNNGCGRMLLLMVLLLVAMGLCSFVWILMLDLPLVARIGGVSLVCFASGFLLAQFKSPPTGNVSLYLRRCDLRRLFYELEEQRIEHRARQERSA